MDAYNRRTNLEKKTLPIALPYMFEAENFSDHPRTYMEVTDLIYTYTKTINEKNRHEYNKRNTYTESYDFK